LVGCGVVLGCRAQQHLDAGEQVVDVERLGDEVVARLEAKRRPPLVGALQ
jgi:hypothetical protein